MSNELPYPPEKIWLQWHGDSDPSCGCPVPTAEVTWNARKVWRGDVEYVRSDFAASQRTQFVRLECALARILAEATEEKYDEYMGYIDEAGVYMPNT